MSTNVTLNGVTFAIPAEGDSGWGTVLSNYFIAIGSGVLQKTAGTFTLTSEVDFGATYGLKSAYLKSQAVNPSGTGILRLGNNESVAWRNNANSSNLSLTVNTSDVLQFNGSNVLSAGGASIVNADVSASAAIAYSKLNLATSIVNADINASAAIAYSKLNLATSIVNADVSASAAIAYSKLALGTSIVNADISGSAAIAYSKLNLATSIVNADINASAAIALSKLAALGVAKALQSNAATGAIEVSSVTNTELGYLSGVTSAIQTQLDAKVLKSLYTAKGSILGATAASTPANLAVGADGLFLKADSSQSTGLVWASAGTTLAVATKTGTYTLTDNDDVILLDCSGGAFTLTLHNPATAVKKVYRLVMTGSGNNKVTLGGYNLNGAARKLCSQYEELSIYPDGTNWQVIEHRNTLPLVSTTLTGSWTTNVTYTCFTGRDGQFMILHGKVVSNGSVPTGSASNYTFTVPNSQTIDTSVLMDTVTASVEPLGYGAVLDSGTNYYSAIPTYNSSTTFTIQLLTTSGAWGTQASSVNWSGNQPMAWAVNDAIMVHARIPITDWW